MSTSHCCGSVRQTSHRDQPINPSCPRNCLSVHGVSVPPAERPLQYTIVGGSWRSCMVVGTSTSRRKHSETGVDTNRQGGADESPASIGSVPTTSQSPTPKFFPLSTSGCGLLSLPSWRLGQQRNHQPTTNDQTHSFCCLLFITVYFHSWPSLSLDCPLCELAH